MTQHSRFWEAKSLFDMTPEEWESICDGCGKCCLSQLEDEESGQLVFTDVACDLFDANSCQCTDYSNRSVRVPHCVTMDASNVEAAAEFAPPSCSYRLLLEGKPLPDWHHLVSGSRTTIHERACSVRNRVRFQRDVNEDELESYIVDWPLKCD